MTQNIFEFLGLPANHRKPEKTTMKVKHINEVPESKKSWPMWGQLKKDGVYGLVVLANRIGVFSRTGKMFTNIHKIPKDLYPLIGPMAYIVELCNDECSLEALSGMVNPNRKKPLSEEQERLMKVCYYTLSNEIWLASKVST
jgi:hypothetical protein